tara:strand:+ start:134 stop:562 length:429 start_codon:yes stop_codon:yes gene_type:complete
MIIRKCSQGHRIRLHRNTTPNAVRQKTYADGTVETLTYPSRYNYFVEVDGEILKRSDSFKTIEEFYVDECAKVYDTGHGRLTIGKHKLINSVATSFTEFPTNSNTVVEIKTFLSIRNILYKSSDNKATLLELVNTLKPNPGG